MTEETRAMACRDLLEKLVERPSITPDDAGCQALLSARLVQAGFTCETLQFGDVTNLWARRGSAGPLLCFAGHTDVVPPGDGWSTEPFTPTERDGLLFGRGTADMKSGLAAMVVAAEQFVAENPDHHGSLAFLITSDEEGRARDGTLKVVEALTERNEKIDWCIVGEPSSSEELGDTLRIGRRGSLSGMLTVRGTQGHVAYPHLADNPITRFAEALRELTGRKWDDGNAHFPPTSFQVVRLHSDSGAPNVTPSELQARFNFRYSTEWSHESLQQQVEKLLDSHDLDYGLDWHLSGEPFLTDGGPLIAATVEAVKDVTGLDPELSTGGGTSDGRFISPAGADVVELGPVSKSIHKLDEHVRIADLDKLREIYADIMRRMLR